MPKSKPLTSATLLTSLSEQYIQSLPDATVKRDIPSAKSLDAARLNAMSILQQMFTAQEELDWQCQCLYGLLEGELHYTGTPPLLTLGQRAFEIVMARQMAAGELRTTWFDRHGSKPITELPDHWPEDYKRLVERRIELIEHDPYINLIERPEYKRRWNTESWEEQERRALRNWLLDRLEDSRYWQEPSLQTTRTLANKAQMDSDFLQVAELYRGHAGFDVHALVAELVEAESVPFLPELRYKTSGLRKREIWEHTWDLQRREDAIDAEVESTLARRA